MSYGNRGYGRGGFGGDRSFGGPKPVEEGKEYEVQIAEISRQGDGIARIQGFVIFVKGSKVGEKTKIKITSVGPRFAIATKAVGNEAQAPQPDQEKKEVAPAVPEEEKPDLQDYKASEDANSSVQQ